jgi:site-specific DNA-methyltransferase (adenine-specific)
MQLFPSPPGAYLGNPTEGRLYGTTMIAALRNGRSSIGVEIEQEYCRMAARYLKAENPSLFSDARLIFEKATTERACLVKEDHELYEVRPAKKKLE